MKANKFGRLVWKIRKIYLEVLRPKTIYNKPPEPVKYVPAAQRVQSVAPAKAQGCGRRIDRRQSFHKALFKRKAVGVTSSATVTNHYRKVLFTCTLTCLIAKINTLFSIIRLDHG